MNTAMASHLFVPLQTFPCEVQTTIPGLLLTCSLFFSSGNTNTVLVTTVGDSPVLTCLIKENTTMFKWTINSEVEGLCNLVYRTDRNETHRGNCSDNINLKFRAGLPSALEIRQVGIAQEGNYSCEMASKDGNFQTTYNLTVLGKECAKVELVFFELKRVGLD